MPGKAYLSLAIVPAVPSQLDINTRLTCSFLVRLPFSCQTQTSGHMPPVLTYLFGEMQGCMVESQPRATNISEQSCRSITLDLSCFLFFFGLFQAKDKTSILEWTPHTDFESSAHSRSCCFLLFFCAQGKSCLNECKFQHINAATHSQCVDLDSLVLVTAENKPMTN